MTDHNRQPSTRSQIRAQCVLAQVDSKDIQRQVEEDTCKKHGVFCCEECFDMTTQEDHNG